MKYLNVEDILMKMKLFIFQQKYFFNAISSVFARMSRTNYAHVVDFHPRRTLNKINYLDTLLVRFASTSSMKEN